MATWPQRYPDESCISLGEYLRTSYSPDCEYVDGRVVERCAGEKGRSVHLGYFAFVFMLHRDEWQVEVFPTLRTRVSRTRVRVPDIVAVRKKAKFGPILDVPPLVVIEILGSEITLSELQEKIGDYLAFGAENICTLDPIRRRAWPAGTDGLHPVESGVLSVARTPIRVVLSEAFAKLVRGL
jgi:Uma2 family endonuclease